MAKKNPNYTNWIIIAVIVASIFGYRYWDKTLKDKLIPRRFAPIVEGKLYRSGCIDEGLIRKVLTEHDIQLIVSLMGQYPVEEQAAQDLGITLKEYRLEGDGTGDITVYANALEDVVRSLNEGKPALIHCVSGTMRSGAFTTFYRILFQNERDSKKIIAELKKYNWEPKKIVLIDYINQNMYTLASMLVDRGILDEIPNPLPQIQFEDVKTYTFEELKEIADNQPKEFESNADGTD